MIEVHWGWLVFLFYSGGACGAIALFGWFMGWWGDNNENN